MKNTCRHYTSQDISRFFDNEIPSARRDEIKRHLGHCRDCRQVLEHYQSVATGVSALVDQQIETIDTVGMRQTLASTFNPENQGPLAKVSKFFSHHLYLKLASVAAIFLICLVPLQQDLFGPSGPSAIVKSVDTDFASVMIIETQKGRHTIIWFSET